MSSSHFKLFQKVKTGLELVSLLHFRDNFWREIFILLYSITWPNFIVWLPLLCEILGNMFISRNEISQYEQYEIWFTLKRVHDMIRAYSQCIAIACKPGCDVMIFEGNLVFLIKLFYYMTKKSWQKLKYLENEKIF